MEPIYIVLIIVLIVWLGIFLYLFYLHRMIIQLSELIKSIKDKQYSTDQNNKEGKDKK